MRIGVLSKKLISFKKRNSKLKTLHKINFKSKQFLLQSLYLRLKQRKAKKSIFPSKIKLWLMKTRN